MSKSSQINLDFTLGGTNSIQSSDTPGSLYREYTESRNSDYISHIGTLPSADKVNRLNFQGVPL